MVDVVSFDFFPFTEYIDLGFTPTEPWSQNFEFLKYETINFIEGLGSIILCMWIGVLYLIMAVGYRVLDCKGKYEKLNKYMSFMDPYYLWDKILSFFVGTFFEVMICVSISMRMFKIWDYLNSSDKFCIANQLIVLCVMIVFVGYITFFTFFRMP